MSSFTHIDDAGRVRMVDVTAKAPTQRTAVAQGVVRMKRATFEKIMGQDIKKGNVLETARIAGIMGAKQTAAHNLVVVNETRQHIGGGTGGDLLLLGEMPGLRLVEADAPAAYASQGIEQYQRTVALIGEGHDRYLVDFFRVRGGDQHDYMFHAADDEGSSADALDVGAAAHEELLTGHHLGLA